MIFGSGKQGTIGGVKSGVNLLGDDEEEVSEDDLLDELEED
ncbi:MAG: hypothetical protein ACYTGH_03555 [Planctomycetota bacterium]